MTRWTTPPDAPPSPGHLPVRSRRLRGDLRASLGDGAAFGGMIGFGETYLSAFVLAAGLGEITAGLVASVPLLAGGVMQMVSPRGVRRLGSHRRWVLLCAAVQAMTFVPLVAAALWGQISTTAAMLIATVYWGAGLATGPAWNTWIGTIVPRTIRPLFFALRTRASQAAVLAGLLVGGLALHSAGSHRDVLTTFAVLFAVAGACRLISVGLLAVHSEPLPLPPGMSRIRLAQSWRHLQTGSGGWLLLYLVAVQAAVQVAGPYFTPFMLEELNMSYGQYVWLLSLSFAAKIIALPVLGRVAHRIGPGRLLWIGGVGITPLAACWLVTQHFSWLVVVQVVGGVMWAAYELAFFLLFFDAIPPEERTSLLTLYNLLNTSAWVAGSLLGGALLYWTAASFHGYLLVFAVSSGARCLALLLLPRVSARTVTSEQISLRPLAVRPGAASLDAPVLPSLTDSPACSS